MNVFKALDGWLTTLSKCTAACLALVIYILQRLHVNELTMMSDETRSQKNQLFSNVLRSGEPDSAVQWCWCDRALRGTDSGWGDSSASSSSPPPHNRCDGSHEHLENCQHGSENKLAILRIQNWIISMGNLIKCKILHISFEIKNIQPHYWQNLRFHPWHFDLKIYS